MSAPRPSGSDAGFTLLEILVVVAVLSILSGLMLEGFRNVGGGWHGLIRHDTSRREVVAARDLVGDLLSRAYPATDRSDQTHPTVSFAGTPDHIEFLGPLSERFGAQDIVAYRLQFSEDGKLMLGWNMSRTGGEDFPRNHPLVTVVIDHLADPNFSYFGRATPNDLPTWQNVWIDRTSLPELIRVRFSQDSSVPHHDEDFIVAPLINGTICDSTNAAQCLD